MWVAWRLSWKDLLPDCMLGRRKGSNRGRRPGFLPGKAGVIVSCSYPIGWSEVKGQVKGRAFYLGHVYLRGGVK